MTRHTNRLVVLGAGGRTGRLILEGAHRQNHPAMAVVRSPERAGLATRAGLDIVAADARDADSLRRALRPGDVIVSAIGPAGRKSNGLYTSVAEAVVTATAGSGVTRFIGITSSGVRSDDPHHPWWYRWILVPLMRNTYEDMTRMELTVAASALDWTFVRPGRLVDEPATGVYRVEDGVNPHKGLAVPRGDVADFVLTCASQDCWSRARPTITR